MESKIEIINHTADIGIKVSGKTIEELFLNSAKGLYEIIDVKYNGYEDLLKINLRGDNLEELLIKFLNELIYYIETKKIGGDIEKVKIENVKGEYELNVELKVKKIENIGKEVKSATYHNLKIEKVKDQYYTVIIFDL
ncbi:MAG: archease [Candidatus Omnitrophica bacterium]|nr:archease [Candidatus Omnitrophota bacterium]